MPPASAVRKSPSRIWWLIPMYTVIALLLAYNRQGIIDTIRLHNYTPPAAVTAIAKADTLTDTGRRILYVNDPQIAAKSSFAKNCPNSTEGTVVLGCYQSNQSGIYLLSVDDQRLAGIEQVTAAHEMLHAAYDRLSSHQKQQIDAQLLDFYNKGLSDDTVKQQIDDYKKTEPDAVVDEMHSLFATEVASLPPGLEQYYARYFNKRSAVVAMYGNYESEFTQRQATIKADDSKLTDMKARIDSGMKSLQQQAASLETQRAALEAKRGSSVAAYNAAVPAYNQAVDAYNLQATSMRQLIQSYNQLVDERNAVAAETNQLIGEISSAVPAAQ